MAMTKTFEQLWAEAFPQKNPIPHLFKHYFAKHWFRIHSLPESKRYAETKAESELILKRHNQIISECFPNKIPIFIVTGSYLFGDEDNSIYDFKNILSYNFNYLPKIKLSETDPTVFDDSDTYYRSQYYKTNWEPHLFNDLLSKIANDEVKAFFISFEKSIIVAPYDGGIDFIIWDDTMRARLQEKYRDWLSPRADRL
ncbi:hypothetical protein [Acinetobacter sp. CFCC 10889]|uniref:DUF3885 domain-containing protein n=1 Tax=Acinetobacter sp. CFCC 10889 TaxID=1775557 RepID=UPI002AF6A564|nr:hypothetical protein [Acinetobacter sp. CFCC 10889]